MSEMKMVGFRSENSKLKVFPIAKDEKQISLRMSLTKAFYAVHTSQLKPAQLVWYVWYRILRVKCLFHIIKSAEFSTLNISCAK